MFHLREGDKNGTCPAEALEEYSKGRPDLGESGEHTVFKLWYT